MMLFTSAFEYPIRFPVDYVSETRRQENCAVRVRRHRVHVLIDDPVALRSDALVSKSESKIERAPANGERASMRARSDRFERERVVADHINIADQRFCSPR